MCYAPGTYCPYMTVFAHNLLSAGGCQQFLQAGHFHASSVILCKCDSELVMFYVQSLHQIRRYPAPYISKAGQKATPSNILQPFIPHCFPLQSPYINSRPFISSPHYFYSSPIRFRICPTPAQPTSILTRIVFPADQQPILNDQFYVEEMPEEIVIVVKLIYSDRTHST